MKCPQCGEESRESRINCLKCGNPLHPQDGPHNEAGQGFGVKEFFNKTPITRKCPACGHFNKDYAKHCTKCGLIIENPARCPQCQAPISPDDRYCPACGSIVRMAKLAHRSNRPIAALVLAIIPGLLSIWGIGHFFAGNFKKGILFLVVGLLLSPVASLFALALNPNWTAMSLVAIIGGIIWLVLWLYQSVDAYWEADEE